MKNFPKTTHHLLGCQRHLGQWAPSLYWERLDAQLNRYLVHLFQDRNFFLSWSEIGRSPTTIIQHELVTPSYVLLAPPVSSPGLDVNGRIDLLVIGSSDWLTMRLPWKNWMRKGEPTEFQATKG